MAMQWVETDKNAHKRRGGDYVSVPPLLKSRLVGCGNFEDTDGLRTDSPVADVDCHNLVTSWCASNKVVIRSADVSNAYLQGVPVNRVILYRIPRGGIPEEGLPDGVVIAARVPIYGTRDAGRGFWLKLREVVTESGFTLNKILNAFFAFRNPDGEIQVVMTTNVDDLLHGCKPEAESAVNKIIEHFKIKQTGTRGSGFAARSTNSPTSLALP